MHVSSKTLLQQNLQVLKSQIPLRYPGRRQVRSWSQTGPKLVTDSELEFGLLSNSLARASRSATSFEHVCDQDSVMGFGIELVCDQI